MDFINNLVPQIQEWIGRFITVESGIQLLTVLSCGLLAAFTNKRWQKYIASRLANIENKKLIEFLLRATNRIAFHSLLLKFLPCSGLFLVIFLLGS